jgi:hypothetical protein
MSNVKDTAYSRKLNTVEDLKQRIIDSLAPFLLNKANSIGVKKSCFILYSRRFEVVRDSCRHLVGSSDLAKECLRPPFSVCRLK